MRNVNRVLFPRSINADLMNKDEIFSKIEEGLKDIEEGNYQEASEFFKEFYESIRNNEI